MGRILAWMNYPISVERWSLLCFTFACLFVVPGCRPTDEISSRTVKAPPASQAAAPSSGSSTKPAAVPAADRGEPTHRMLAAILKAGDQAWFLKAVGSIDAIAAAKPPIDEFLRTVKVEDGQPVWDVPEGWTEKPASQMRLATLVIPAEGVPEGIELSVIGLPLVGEDWPAQVLSNVNRWRKQIGRDPVPPAELSEVTTPMSVVDGAALMDETGWYGGGMAPFANAPFAQGSSTPAPSAPSAQQPFVHPPMIKSMDAMLEPAPATDELKFDTPDGWTAKRGSAIRKASLATPGDAEVTAFAFPNSAPGMADPLANINRWRGEVGLEPTTAEKLAEESSEITLSGDTATYVELVGESETTYAAMTERGSQVWFFKLRGTSEAVATQQEAFKAWLSSMQIAE